MPLSINLRRRRSHSFRCGKDLRFTIIQIVGETLGVWPAGLRAEHRASGFVIFLIGDLRVSTAPYRYSLES